MTLLKATVVAASLLTLPAVAQPAAPQRPMGEHMMGQHGATQGPGPHGGPMMMGPGMMQGQGMMHGQGMMPNGGPMMQGYGMMDGEHGNRGLASATPRIEGRLAFLKAELKITDVQMQAWNTFADAVRTNITTMNAERQAMRGRVGADVPLPDRVLAQANAFAAHAEEMTKLKAALDPLYATLSPEQKKVADEIVFSPMGVPVGM